MHFVSKAKGLCPVVRSTQSRDEPRQGRALGKFNPKKNVRLRLVTIPVRPFFLGFKNGLQRLAFAGGARRQSPLALLRTAQERRASVSVEFALVSVMVLLPLLAGGADFVELISAQSQLDASLQSLYAFAWNSPASATNTAQLNGVLGLVNAHLFSQVSLGSAPALSYQTAASGQETFVTYHLAATVNLPVPVPYILGSSFALAASGSVQIQ
jgi:hypothetical protein